MTTDPLPLTGERTVPGIPSENYWFRRHEAAYRWAAPRLAAQTIAEIGCGEGYGTALFAESAQRVIGLDYDSTTIAHAHRTYPRARFVRGNLAALPFATACLDAIATLQVIEHVWDHGQFLAECRHALRPAGVLLVTTPNRLTFSPGRDQPLNPFHTKEFAADELTHLLTSAGFAIDAIFGLHAGPRIVELDERYGSFADAQLATEPAHWPRQLLRDVASIEATDFPIVAAAERDIDIALDLVVLGRRA